ncbi:MAG: diacylglycerol kinase family protein [Halieaceae bacterium]
MKTLFVVNSATGGASNIRDRLAALPPDSGLSSVSIEFTEYAGHATDIARLQCSSVELIVAVGGDGTLNEVVNGCMAAAADNVDMALPVLGVVASGTANDFVRSTGLKGTLEELVQLAGSASIKPIDLGCVNFLDERGGQSKRYFINVADMGIGASVVRRVNAGGRRFGANMAYLWAILMAFVQYRKPLLQVRSNMGLDWQGRALACIVGNGRAFGSGLYAVPQAVIDDGQLHSVIIGDVSLLDFARKLPRLKRGQPIEHPEVVYHAAKSLTLSVLDGRCAMEVDGEYLDCSDVTVTVLPAAIKLLLP